MRKKKQYVNNEEVKLMIDDIIILNFPKTTVNVHKDVTDSIASIISKLFYNSEFNLYDVVYKWDILNGGYIRTFGNYDYDASVSPISSLTVPVIKKLWPPISKPNISPTTQITMPNITMPNNPQIVYSNMFTYNGNKVVGNQQVAISVRGTGNNNRASRRKKQK